MTTHRRGLALVMLQVTFQWVIYLQVGWDSIAGTWAVFNPDTFATLTVARTWAHGHPLRLLPHQNPGTILSDLLSPLFYSAGYWIGFRSPSSFMLWAYILCFIVSLLACRAVWSFFHRFAPEVVFPATALCMAFPGIYVNIYCTNFGFLFLFFWAAMASFHSFPRFLTFAILASLMRPEGALTFAFLVALYVSVHGMARAWRFAFGFMPLAIPPLVYRHLTGGFFPQGVVPQNIVHYQGVVDGMRRALPVAADQVKGALLGYFPAGASIGVQDAAWLGVLPPGVFLFALYGLWATRRSWCGFVAVYLVILTIADSFTVFAGLHYNRHLHILTPLFMGFALRGLRRLCGTRIRPHHVGLGMLGVLVVLQFLSTLDVNRRSVRGLARDKLVADHLLAHFSDHPIIDSRGRLLYWADTRLDLIELSPATDADLGRHVRYYWRLIETGEAVQRLHDRPVVLFSEDGAEDVISRWLFTFRKKEIASFVARYTDTVRLSLLDLSALADSAPYPEPLAELDVGDHCSEREYGYSYRDSLPAPLGAFLLPGEGFMDGGRPGVVEERFTLPVPEDGGVLVARIRGDYPGRTLRLFGSEPATFSLPESPLLVTANDDTVSNRTLHLSPGFSHVAVPLARGGLTRFHVRGSFNSFHYWVYPPSVMRDGAMS